MQTLADVAVIVAGGDDSTSGSAGSERSLGGSSREASPSAPPEDPEAAAQRRLREDVVLMRATKIRAQRATKARRYGAFWKISPAGPEPRCALLCRACCPDAGDKNPGAAGHSKVCLVQP